MYKYSLIGMKALGTIFFYKLSHEWWNLTVSQRETILNNIDNEISKLSMNKYVAKIRKFLVVGKDIDMLFLLFSYESELPIYLKFRIEKIFQGLATLKDSIFGGLEINEQQEQESDLPFLGFLAMKSEEISSLRAELAAQQYILSMFRIEKNSRAKLYIIRSGDLKEKEFGMLFLVPNLSDFLYSLDKTIDDLQKRGYSITRPLIIAQDRGFNLLLA
jgi:hypothetical protein